MTTSRIRGALSAALLATVVAGAAAQQHVPLSDRQIGAQVEHRLIDEGTRDVSVAVRERVVTFRRSTSSSGTGESR